MDKIPVVEYPFVWPNTDLLRVCSHSQHLTSALKSFHQKQVDTKSVNDAVLLHDRLYLGAHGVVDLPEHFAKIKETVLQAALKYDWSELMETLSFHENNGQIVGVLSVSSSCAKQVCANLLPQVRWTNEVISPNDGVAITIELMNAQPLPRVSNDLKDHELAALSSVIPDLPTRIGNLEQWWPGEECPSHEWLASMLLPVTIERLRLPMENLFSLIEQQVLEQKTHNARGQRPIPRI